MDLFATFQSLGARQLAIQESIELLQSLRVELSRNRSAADAWATVAIMANVTLIPLNAIINAFQLGSANSVYQHLVRQMYAKAAGSGTRIDGHAKTTLALLKQAITNELKRKGLKDYIPGANILVGLAEDSLAAWQVVQLIDAGNREMSARVAQVDRQLQMATNQLVELGVVRADIFRRLQVRSRTA